MKCRIELHIAAQKELSEAFQWYRYIKSSLKKSSIINCAIGNSFYLPTFGAFTRVVSEVNNGTI